MYFSSPMLGYSSLFSGFLCNAIVPIFSGFLCNACPLTLILACVLPAVACSLHCLTKANPDGIFLILNANSVRNSLEANSEFRCKCISKFIRGHPKGPPPPRVGLPTTGVSIHSTLRLVPHKSIVQHVGEAAQK